MKGPFSLLSLYRRKFKQMALFFSIFISWTIPQYSVANQLVILHTNDHHGHYIQDPKQRIFGMAARKTLIDQLKGTAKTEGKSVLLLSGGDINTGTPESDFFDAEPDFRAMNMMGYDAMSIGNHEFDNPFKVLLKQQSWSKFPFLAANIYYSKGKKKFNSSVHRDKDRPFKPYMVKMVGDKKVLIVGLTTEETAKFTKVKDVIFRPALEEAKTLLPKLNREIKPDLTVALTHLGYFVAGMHRGFPADFSLAKNLGKKHLDIIVGGHTQKALVEPHVVNGVAIVQAGEWGKYLGKMEVKLLGNRKYKISSYNLLGVNYKAVSSDFARREDVQNIRKVKNMVVKEDPKVSSYLRNFYKKYPVKLDEAFATIDSDFDGRGRGRGKETNLGRLVSHSICYITHGDICFFNNGGLRIDLNKGTITRRDILALMPFNNELCHVKIKTKELVGYLEKIYKATKYRSTHFSGVRFSVVGDKIKELYVNIEKGNPSLIPNNSLKKVYSNGKVLKDQLFDIASTCFLTRGRDGYPNMEKVKTHKKYGINAGIEYRDSLVFIDFLKQKKNVLGKEYSVDTIQSK